MAPVPAVLGDGDVKAVPDQPALGADHRPHGVGRTVGRLLEHPVEVRQAETVALMRPGGPVLRRRRSGQPRRGERRDQRPERGPLRFADVDRLVVAHLDRVVRPGPVRASLAPRQHVGPPLPAAQHVGGQPTADHHRHALPHGQQGLGLVQRRWPPLVHHQCIGVLCPDGGQHLGLEGGAGLGAQLLHVGRRAGLGAGGWEQLVLHPERTALGHIPAPRCHVGHVALRCVAPDLFVRPGPDHGPMVRSPGDSEPARHPRIAPGGTVAGALPSGCVTRNDHVLEQILTILARTILSECYGVAPVGEVAESVREELGEGSAGPPSSEGVRQLLTEIAAGDGPLVLVGELLVDLTRWSSTWCSPTCSPPRRSRATSCRSIPTCPCWPGWRRPTAGSTCPTGNRSVCAPPTNRGGGGVAARSSTAT